MPLEVVLKYEVLLFCCSDRHLAMEFWSHPAQFKPLKILLSKHNLSDDSNIGKVNLFPEYPVVFTCLRFSYSGNYQYCSLIMQAFELVSYNYMMYHSPQHVPTLIVMLPLDNIFLKIPGLVWFVTNQMYKLVFSRWALGVINQISCIQNFSLDQIITHLGPSRTHLYSVINRSHGPWFVAKPFF